MYSRMSAVVIEANRNATEVRAGVGHQQACMSQIALIPHLFVVSSSHHAKIVPARREYSLASASGHQRRAFSPRAGRENGILRRGAPPLGERGRVPSSSAILWLFVAASAGGPQGGATRGTRCWHHQR